MVKKVNYPRWLLRPAPCVADLNKTARFLGDLPTICTSAACPNIFECFARKQLTFMILGNICTRKCNFCAVTHGEPTAVDPEEAERIAAAVLHLGLAHVVITSVSRDDLEDGGASHYARTINVLRQKTKASVEVLIPDFGGNRQALEQVVGAEPDLIAHNLETVARLQNCIRPQGDYGRSLQVLCAIKEINPKMITKSGLMLGLGEEDAEVLTAMQDLLEAGCDILTVGQYRQPGAKQTAVQRFILETGFNYFREKALQMGFRYVLAGSYVRSSYRAEEAKKLLNDDRARIDRKRGLN